MNKNIQISIITPVRNDEKNISKTIKSIITYISHLKEETKIRIKNKQNIILIIAIFINGILKNAKRIMREL